jgi:hypothetical protein
MVFDRIILASIKNEGGEKWEKNYVIMSARKEKQIF